MIEIKCTKKEKELLVDAIKNYNINILYELQSCGLSACPNVTNCTDCIDKSIKWIIED